MNQTTPASEPGSSTGTFIPALARLEWLLLLTALALVVLVYPLRLQDAWLGPLIAWWREHDTVWSHWTQAQFEPILSFQYSPLILKGVVAGFLMIAFVAVRWARLLLTPVMDGAGTLNPPEVTPQARWAGLGAGAFFLWMAISKFWSPTPLLAQDAAVWVVLFGVFTVVLLRRGLDGAELRQLGALLMLLGIPVILIIYLQALPVFGGKIFLVMQDFGNIRNKFGSLLGHNTAAASFLMMTAFPAFAFLVTARSRLRRGLAGVYLAALLFAVLVLQSRAIWVIFPVLGLLALRSVIRQVGARQVRWLPTAVLAAMALILVTQLADRPWNPFYVRDNPFGRRIKDLSPEGLQGEARLRLNIIGATLVVPERPLFGHGLYAYQYVYPRRQGDYFKAHPTSKLNQTLNRSHMAHDEYMQVLIDHGVVGLGLMAWMLGSIAWRGWRGRREWPTEERLLHEAFGWSALGFALHGFVDFPFHVPQLALPGLICLAAWGSSSRPVAPRSVLTQPTHATVQTRYFRWEHFLRLLLAMALVLLIPIASLPLGNALQADVYFVQGGALVESVYQYQKLDEARKVDLLLQARKKLIAAVKLMPAHYLAWQRLGEVYLQLGTIDMRQARRADGRLNLSSPMIEKADRLFNQGLQIVDKASQGLDYHGIYWLRAQFYRHLRTLEPGRGYEAKYLDQLMQTLHYCPAFSGAAMLLAEQLNRNPNADLKSTLPIRRQLLRLNPSDFERLYVRRATEYLMNKQYGQAVMLWEEVLTLGPRSGAWKATAVLANVLGGQRARALELARQLQREDPVQLRATHLDILEAALEQRWPDMLAELERIKAPAAGEVANYCALTQEARRKVGGDGRSESHFTRPAEVNELAWRQSVAEARVMGLLYYFNDPQGARRAADERLTLGGQPTIGFWLDSFAIARAVNDPAFAERCYQEAYKLNPTHPVLEEMFASLPRETKNSAPPAWR